MSDYRLVRARSAAVIRSPSSSMLITRTRSVPDLSVYQTYYKPQWSYWRTPYSVYDNWYSRYLTNRYYYPYTYRSSLYSNYSWDTLSYPYSTYSSYYRYGYPYYNYYYSRPYNPYLSARLNYLSDRTYWWERDRYFVPTYYYRRYYDWLYD